jgi:HNH endonuclease
MNRYFFKIDPIKDCVGGFGQSRMAPRWESGEIVVKSKGPRFAGKDRNQPAPAIQPGDELWIWTHENKGGQGLVAKATAASANVTGGELRVILNDVVLVPSPFSFDKFKKRPDNGHYTGTRLLDYKSIDRGTGVYLIEDDDYPEFVDVVEKFGGKLPSHSEANGLEIATPPSGFSWADEIKKQKDEIISDLTERRLNWQKVRPVQSKFRDDLFDLYDKKCVLTPCGVPEAIEAAHVLPHNGDPVRDRPDNGLLLRRDLHTMFDAMLWSIDPKTNKVRLARRLVDKSYGSLEGKVIDHQVDPDALLFHFTQFQKADKNV